MKVFIINEQECGDLMRRISLARFQAPHSALLTEEMSDEQRANEMHRVFNYEVVRWLQEVVGCRYPTEGGK